MTITAGDDTVHASVVHHLKYWSVPLSAHMPYIDQPQLQALANAIPRTKGGLANAAGGTREQADWFEYEPRNIPLMGRWFPALAKSIEQRLAL